MELPSPNSRRIAFDRFEADLRSGELRKNGRSIRLQAQPFQLLALLLEHPSEVVSREEVCRKLWNTDTFVDFDHSLGTAINKIREALGDSAERPRFVETLPRRGYRFIAEIAPESQPTVPAEWPTGAHTRPRWLLPAVSSLAILGCTLAVGFAHRWVRAPQASARLRAVPFTTLPGLETSRAFSPDGSRIAFAWNGDPASGGKGFDLYLKTIGSETLLRLTHHPSEWISPTWSPDGTQIAFHRMAGADTGLYVVPALGGPERKLRSTRIPYALAAPISWSPDGKWIGFGEPLPEEPADRIFLLSVEGLNTQQIPHNPKCFHEALPTFSHSGRELAYLCVHSTSELELYSVAAVGGTPRRITGFSGLPSGFTWSADDSRLLLSQAGETGLELDEVMLADGSLRRLDFALGAASPSVAPKGDKLAYSMASVRTDVWRKDLLHPESASIELIASTRAQDAAQYSPDGKHIAFESDRAGSREIWMSDVDGNNLVQLSKLNGSMGVPRWSPDGRKIAFDSYRSGNLEIHIVDISEQIPRKLATNISKLSTPNWSRDGKWIYFTSFGPTGRRLYRCPAPGGNATLLGGQAGGLSPQESFDGTALYFATRDHNTRLTVISPNSSFSASAVEGLPPIVHQDLWVVVPGGIYFVPVDAPKSLCYFEFSTRNIRRVFDSQNEFGEGLSVSPDGRWLLYSQVDEENSDIMLVENFH